MTIVEMISTKPVEGILGKLMEIYNYQSRLPSRAVKPIVISQDLYPVDMYVG